MYRTSAIFEDEKGKVRNVARAFANVAAAQTDSVLVAAATGYKIRVLAVVMSAAGTATAATFNTKGAGAGTAISALFTNGVNIVSQGLGFNPDGWFETLAGEALTVTTGAGSATGFQFTYALVK